jgi:diguanylate cyclase (GGDEF)-like protein
MHPDDRTWVPDFCVAQSKAGVDHEADYRALNKDGSYVWIRDVVHVVRNEEGVVEALVGFMFDISERKRTEDRLLIMQRELEDLSFKDGLTGLINRRRFDTLVQTEWGAARRTKQPLSLLMIDIDFFKQYNDRYGHVRGDDCLKRIAETLRAGASRPRDFLARYGGEEFVLVLPDTDAKGAEHIAERCREAVANQAIEHGASTVAPHVTISVGVGTIVPSVDGNPRSTSGCTAQNRRGEIDSSSPASAPRHLALTWIVVLARVVRHRVRRDLRRRASRQDGARRACPCDP